jgi:Phage integrase central domain
VPVLLTALRRIENRGAVEIAHRALQNCGQIFRYAIATGRAERDPSADLRGALSPVIETRHASTMDPKATLLTVAVVRSGHTTTQIKMPPTGGIFT